MKKERLERASSIAKKLSWEYLSETFKELTPKFGIIGITDVNISNDLSYADILVSSTLNSEELPKALAESANSLQQHLAKNIAFIKIPKVRFRLDESIERSSGIYKTLHEISNH